MLVRFVKLCASGGESPPSPAANKPPEFGTKGMNGKVKPTAQDRGLLGGRRTGGAMVGPGRTTVEKRTQGKARAASRTRILLKQFSLERTHCKRGGRQHGRTQNRVQRQR